ncbi:MAG: phosphoglucosamine mutase [candidate division KSB1 bacterium]|nr:phosphoglucosamine mutase [candidate division KSB1 bacterium]
MSSERLMVSVSGIRGTVGGSLTPEVVLRYAQAYGTTVGEGAIVVGRDSRVTGEMVMHGVFAGLLSVGRDVIDLGVVPTPTTQLAVEKLRARGGIVITASHNPIQWNALKLLAEDGLFLGPDQGEVVNRLAREAKFPLVPWDRVGKVRRYERAVADHLEAIERLSVLDLPAIRRRRFKVVVDCCHGAGGVILPQLCARLGCEAHFLYEEPNGLFPRNPEPRPEHLGELCQAVKSLGADIGFAVDPDVDRLAIVSERGEPLGEDYTLVLAVKLILSKRTGKVVVNASTTRAIDDVAAAHGAEVVRAKVGEINVALKAREVGAVIAGEGNGGVMLPELHLGRDAPVGIALTLQHLVEFGGTISALNATLPQYVMVKDRVELPGSVNPAPIVQRLAAERRDERLDLLDGVKILYDRAWVHVRPSNTEPIIRIIAEAPSAAQAQELVDSLKHDLMRIAG